MTTRRAGVHLENHTGMRVTFQVLHQYTGEAIEESPWVPIDPGAEAGMLTVTYYTGLGTTGVDNWIVNGIERRAMTPQIQAQGIPALLGIPLGAEFDLRWSSGEGLFSDWKVHTLRSEDRNKNTIIRIYPTLVEFVSASGTSSTGWFPEYNIPEI